MAPNVGDKPKNHPTPRKSPSRLAWEVWYDSPLALPQHREIPPPFNLGSSPPHSGVCLFPHGLSDAHDCHWQRRPNQRPPSGLSNPPTHPRGSEPPPDAHKHTRFIRQCFHSAPGTLRCTKALLRSAAPRPSCCRKVRGFFPLDRGIVLRQKTKE